MGEPRHQFAWTDEIIAVAKDGMERGLSAAQIGLKINCTRNAVIGKMGRMGIKSANGKGHQPGVPAPWKSIPRVPKPPRPNMMTINARAARKDPFKAPRPPIPPENRAERPADLPVCRTTFEELSPGGCRWPEGDATPYLFCDAPQVKDFPYCACHCAIAYRPTPGLIRQREQYDMVAA